MRRRWVRLGLLGLAVFLVALIAQIPAGWGLYLLRDRLPVQIAWQGAAGTIYDAAIERLAVALPGGRQIVLGPVTVDPSLLPAVTGSVPVAFQIEGYDGQVTGTARMDLNGWHLPKVQGRLALGALPRLVPQLEAAGLSGGILFRGEDLAGAYRGLPTSGKLRATAEDLGVGLIQTERPLGDYALDLQLKSGSSLNGEIRTVADRALLGVEGTVQGSLGTGRLRFQGQGWTPDDAPQAIRDILPLLGQVRDGRVRIQWQGRIR